MPAHDPLAAALTLHVLGREQERDAPQSKEEAQGCHDCNL
jgi:hypothetical protein